MREVYKAIGRVAAQDVPVLITGESGTGKELVARAIYQHGPRSRAPFLALNCAAIPENLLESELFGYEKGAFTGADRRRIGKFEQCNGGTIFLDEIGDMPLALQAKMLRLLQEQAFERIGGNETVQTDVRLIAATHRDLKAWSDEGKFRSDLYYRLNVFTIHLPPLRERGDDLLPSGSALSPAVQPRPGAGGARGRTRRRWSGLRRHSWPGNIRELQSVLKQALLQASGPSLLPAFLPTLPEEPSRPDADSPPASMIRSLEIVHPARVRPRSRRPVRGGAPPGGPPPADPRPGGNRREPESGRPPAGDRARDPAPETPRTRAPLHSPTRSRGRVSTLAPDPSHTQMTAMCILSGGGSASHSGGRFRGRCLKSCHLIDGPAPGRAARDAQAVRAGFRQCVSVRNTRAEAVLRWVFRFVAGPARSPSRSSARRLP